MKAIAGLGVFLGAALIGVQAAHAVRLSDGRVYFVQPPRLVNTVTTERSALARNATYYFTIDVPANSDEPLGQVAITQRDGDSAARRVEFEVEESVAFVGTRRQQGAKVSIANTTFDNETNTVTLQFNPPIPPGTTVTIGVDPERNPRTGGIYLYGVTAFPAGDRPYGQFLGYGRIDINDPSDDLLFFN
ncbi:MAG: DUF2808 domain-containing protein [Leptolyngbyaceae cyanobacterium SM1_3_5]|nr:DUF2808 domain-containing protein [Leptolyngbyaceae cyanobacterium SM1_3_5]